MQSSRYCNTSADCKMGWKKLLRVSLSLLVIICVTSQISQVDGGNILGLFTSHSPSHLIIHMTIAKVLAERGHNVTVVASQVPKVNHDNINLIIIPPTREQEEYLNKEVAGMALKKNNLFTIIGNFFGNLALLIEMQADMLKDARFTTLYENPDTKFDLVIVGFFMNSFELGVAAKFNTSLIISWSGAPLLFTDLLVGNPSEVSFVPDFNIALKVGEKMSFLQRVQNLFSHLFFRLFKELLDIRMRQFYNELFPNDRNFPNLSDMEKNVSVIFCNGHFSEGTIRAHVPAVIEIGGIQIKDTPDDLPKDIANFLNSANETGAILFSLGSNLKGSSIKPETATYIFNVLSKLKQKIIWKWENLENTPGNSPNILYKKWMPQDDILAHPNIKLFITHAGKGGVAEAQYHGVPMLALPVFADQHGNAKKIVAAGYGLQLELLSLTEQPFKNAILEILSNPQYAKNVQTFSQLYRDRPLTARESVVFWTEYVMRHHGAAHMQSPLVHMNSIEALNLDVYLFIAFVVYLIYRIFRYIKMFLSSKLCKKKVETKTKTTTKIKSQ